jgi:flagellar biosynthesis protein FlhG
VTGCAGRLLAIASGKGGVGKTWLSISLAQALAERGRRVLLVDADFGLANIDVQLGLDPGRDLGDALHGAAAPRPHPAGFALLAGRSGSGALAGLEAAPVLALLARLRASYDEVVLDLPAGVAPAVRRLAARSDLLLVLATGEPTSLTDAYAVLKLHRQDAPAGAARLVVNQAPGAAAGEATWRTLDTACRRFLGAGVPLAAVIRRDAQVPAAIRAQAPLLTRSPGAPAVADVRALAAGLCALAPVPLGA